jgi:DNA-binding winged helix-turn-helix (wHTH) protein
MDQVAFKPFSFDRRAVRLTRDGEIVAIGARRAALLTVLLDADGAVVSKTEFMERVAGRYGGGGQSDCMSALSIP